MARDGSQHQRNWIATGRDGQPPKRDAGDLRLCSSSVRQTWRRSCVKIDHPRDNCHRLVLQLLNAKAAHLQETGESGRRPRNQPAVRSFDMDSVVGYQPCKDRQPATGSGVEEIEREPRLS
jgi:hypothetical protein